MMEYLDRKTRELAEKMRRGDRAAWCAAAAR